MRSSVRLELLRLKRKLAAMDLPSLDYGLRLVDALVAMELMVDDPDLTREHVVELWHRVRRELAEDPPHGVFNENERYFEDDGSSGQRIEALWSAATRPEEG